MDVLLIEDDPVHRAFLKEVIEAAMPECSRLLEADDGQIGAWLFAQPTDVAPAARSATAARPWASSRWCTDWNASTGFLRPGACSPLP